MQFHWKKMTLSLELARYGNGRVAVVIMHGFSKYGMLSTNLADLELAYEEFFVPLWNHDDAFLRMVLATGAFEDTERRAFGPAWSETQSGAEAAIWRIVDPVMLAKLAAWMAEDMQAVDAGNAP